MVRVDSETGFIQTPPLAVNVLAVNVLAVNVLAVNFGGNLRGRVVSGKCVHSGASHSILWHIAQVYFDIWGKKSYPVVVMCGLILALLVSLAVASDARLGGLCSIELYILLLIV